MIPRRRARVNRFSAGPRRRPTPVGGYDAADGAARRVPRRRVRAVGQDRRPGRRRRRARARARPPAGRRRRRPRSTSSCRATASVPDPPAGRVAARPSSASRTRGRRPGVSEVAVDRCRGRRLPAAPRRPPAGVRPRRLLRRRRRRLRRQRLAVRAVLPGGARGAPRATAGPSTSSTSTTGTPARRRIFRDARYADDPVIGRAAIVTDAPQPRLPRLDAAGAARPARAAAGRRGRRRRTPTGIDLLRAGDRAGRARQHGLARVRGRGAHARRSGWASTALLRAQGDRFIGILNGLDTERLGPGDRRRPRRAVRRATTSPGKAACRADLLTRRRLRPRRRRAGPRADRAAGPAEGLRPPRRRGARRCSRRGARIVVQGSGHPALADPFRALAAGAPGPRRAHRALRPRHGPPDLRGRRTCSSCRRGSSRAARAR